MTPIDREKCSFQDYGLREWCKHQKEYYEGCSYCTRVVDIGYSFIICGVPVGSGIAYYHQYFEERSERNESGNDIHSS